MTDELQLTIDSIQTDDTSSACIEPIKAGQSSPMVIGSLVNGITGVGIWSITQPIVQSGPLLSLIVIIIVVCSYGLSSYLEAVYIPPHDGTMYDEVIAAKFPKYRKTILWFTKVSAFLFIFGTDIDLYMYFSLVVKDQIFQRFSSTENTNYYIIVPIIITFLFGALKNTALFVRLSGVSMLGNVLSMICIMVMTKDITNADWKCWKDNFVDGGFFNTKGIKDGWGAVFSFAGVIAMCSVSQNFAHVPLGEAKNPEKNRRDVFIVYTIVLIMYIIIWVCSGPRFACDITKAQSLYLNQVDDEHWWYGIVTQIAYGFECLLSLPLFLSVSRECSSDLYRWKSERGKYIGGLCMNAFLIAVMSVLTVLNISLQFILMIAGLVATIMWMIVLPFGWHLYNRPALWRYIWYGLISLVVGGAMIIQFALPIPGA